MVLINFQSLWDSRSGMSSESETEVFISNIKASFKLDPPVEFEFVKNRCSELPQDLGIVCYQKIPNILTIRIKKWTFTLFKRSVISKSDESITINQHCNICNGKSEEDICSGINEFLFLIHRPPKLINFVIDNYSCVTYFGCEIPLHLIYSDQPSIYYRYNPERSQALDIRCPDFISATRSGRLCGLLYRTGKCVIIGGNDMSEILEFVKWIKFMISGKHVQLL